MLWKLTELKKQDGRLQSYESLGLNFHSALTACGFGQVPSPAGLTGLWDLVPEPPYCPPLAGWAQQPCRMEWAGEEYKHICLLDCRFSSLIQNFFFLFISVLEFLLISFIFNFSFKLKSFIDWFFFKPFSFFSGDLSLFLGSLLSLIILPSFELVLTILFDSFSVY